MAKNSRKLTVVRQSVSETLQRMKLSYTKIKVSPTDNDIIPSIDDKTLLGLDECDIHVPDEKEKFAKVPPIFKNIEVSWVEVTACETTPRKIKSCVLRDAAH